mmetsp:Transcript_1460/g.3127  ORF Transcript_1460/g.3127 Transcript_1460/m.3127 type:complete len:408 (+) Transcript_1460:114-1337(+)
MAISSTKTNSPVFCVVIDKARVVYIGGSVDWGTRGVGLLRAFRFFIAGRCQVSDVELSDAIKGAALLDGGEELGLEGQPVGVVGQVQLEEARVGDGQRAGPRPVLHHHLGAGGPGRQAGAARAEDEEAPEEVPAHVGRHQVLEPAGHRARAGPAVEAEAGGDGGSPVELASRVVVAREEEGPVGPAQQPEEGGRLGAQVVERLPEAEPERLQRGEAAPHQHVPHLSVHVFGLVLVGHEVAPPPFAPGSPGGPGGCGQLFPTLTRAARGARGGGPQRPALRGNFVHFEPKGSNAFVRKEPLQTRAHLRVEFLEVGQAARLEALRGIRPVCEKLVQARRKPAPDAPALVEALDHGPAHGLEFRLGGRVQCLSNPKRRAAHRQANQRARVPGAVPRPRATRRARARGCRL